MNSPEAQEAASSPPFPPSARAHPTFAQAFRFWLKLGFISFGGPTGQIAIMHTELVERKKWIGESRFLHALNFCMLLPGPEAAQLATYIGWLLHGLRGGLAAGILFVLPSVFILWGLSYVYAAYGQVAWIASVFYGLKPAVIAIVACAVWRIGQRALQNRWLWGFSALAFLALFAFQAPFPAVLLTAGLSGLLGGKFMPALFPVRMHQDAAHAGAAILGDTHATPEHAKPSWTRALKVSGVCLVLWWLPVLALGYVEGWGSTLFQQGLFFSKAAMVTFGGAYAVLPYVAQIAVDEFHWLSAAQMMDGLGLAETTPGPLIMVVQFVAFMGGWNGAGDGNPLAHASACALLATWVTFTPCFLWIFLGAPYIEQWRGQTRLNHALSAITAAVVGVVLNLAVWFGVRVLFPEEAFWREWAAGGMGWRAVAGHMDLFALALATLAFLAMRFRKWEVVPVVLASGLAGLGYRMLAGH